MDTPKALPDCVIDFIEAAGRRMIDCARDLRHVTEVSLHEVFLHEEATAVDSMMMVEKYDNQGRLYQVMRGGNQIDVISRECAEGVLAFVRERGLAVADALTVEELMAMTQRAVELARVLFSLLSWLS